MPALTLVIETVSTPYHFESRLEAGRQSSLPARRARRLNGWKKDVRRFGLREQPHVPCSTRILDIRGAAFAAPGNSDKQRSGARAAHHARVVSRYVILNDDVLDLA